MAVILRAPLTGTGPEVERRRQTPKIKSVKLQRFESDVWKHFGRLETGKEKR